MPSMVLSAKCLMLSPQSDPVQLKANIKLLRRGVLRKRVVETEANLRFMYIMDVSFIPLVVR